MARKRNHINQEIAVVRQKIKVAFSGQRGVINTELANYATGKQLQMVESFLKIYI